MDKVLKKCPFCRGDAELIVKYDYLYTVQCKKCKIGTDHLPKEIAIGKWNFRAEADYYPLPCSDSVGRRIKFLRKEKKNISLVNMAKEINENWTVISAWEHGNAEPSLDTIIKLADYFDCTTDFLLKGVKNSE